MPKQNSVDWVARTSDIYFSVWEVGQSKFKVLADEVLDESPLSLQNHLLVFSHSGEGEGEGEGRGKGREKVLWSFLIRALMSSWGPCPHDLIKPNYPPKAPFPNTITLEVRALTYGLWGTQTFSLYNN